MRGSNAYENTKPFNEDSDDYENCDEFKNFKFTNNKHDKTKDGNEYEDVETKHEKTKDDNEYDDVETKQKTKYDQDGNEYEDVVVTETETTEEPVHYAVSSQDFRHAKAAAGPVTVRYVHSYVCMYFVYLTSHWMVARYLSI